MGKPVKGDFGLLYPSKYIKAADLHERDVTVVIDHVEMGELMRPGTSKPDKKPVVFMRSLKGVLLEKGWVCGITSARVIAEQYGKKVEAWTGKQITLYPTIDRGPKGGMVDCIRVRPRPNADGGEVPGDMAAPPDPQDREQDFAAAASDDGEAQPVASDGAQ